jgi:hypothetical protein
MLRTMLLAPALSYATTEGHCPCGTAAAAAPCPVASTYVCAVNMLCVLNLLCVRDSLCMLFVLNMWCMLCVRVAYAGAGTSTKPTRCWQQHCSGERWSGAQQRQMVGAVWCATHDVLMGV